jgi:hypothetical protein
MALLQKNGNLHLFWWFCWEKGDGSNVIAFLYGGDVVKKAMATIGFFFFFFWSFWFNSLKLTIHNEMVGFFMLKVVMVRGRRLKKGGGDLEVHKKNVVALD